MNRLVHPQDQTTRYLIVAVAFAVYVALFAILIKRMGLGIASWSSIPVIAGSWYFGVKGGLICSLLSIPMNMILLSSSGHLSFTEFFESPSLITGTLSVTIVAVIIGSIGTIT